MRCIGITILLRLSHVRLSVGLRGFKGASVMFNLVNGLDTVRVVKESVHPDEIGLRG